MKNAANLSFDDRESPPSVREDTDRNATRSGMNRSKSRLTEPLLACFDSAEAPTRDDHATIVSLFAGCGGIDLGFSGGFEFMNEVYERHPFRILQAYDNDEKAILTYKQNISDNASVMDLAEFDPASMPPATVLIGGFPCQDFASCGLRQGLRSTRGRLYLALVAYAMTHSPMVIVGENVPGLATMHQGATLGKIVEDIAAVGYRTEVWDLSAPDYGVPQNRKRLFIVGVREDLSGFPERPTPTHAAAYRSIRWAIEDLETVTDDAVPNQSQFFRATRAKRGNGQGDEVSHADRPAYTVRANAKSRVQFHYHLERRLTVRECARLQTFPDSFSFPHSATTNVMQIGNAVPPVLAHHVARQISSWIGEQTNI